jgi:hypothetical protein
MSDTPPTTGNNNHGPQDLPKEGSQLALLNKASQFLIDRNRIGDIRIGYRPSRRSARLKLQDMFNALVKLYTTLIKSNWSHFQRLAEKYQPQSSVPLATPGTTNPTHADFAKHMATIYISHWFMDLYASIKKASEGLSVLASQQFYDAELETYSNEYDVFLQHLNSVIRPTQIFGTLEESLYYPVFEKITATSLDNPFNIEGFFLDLSSFESTIKLMKDKRNGWHFAKLAENKTGRPVWLFDWLDADTMCAWFPQELNYTAEDCVFAFILGVACTPKLAPRDKDDPQMYPDNLKPSNPSSRSYQRIRERTFWAQYEAREFDPDITETVTFSNPYLNLFPHPFQRKRKSRKEHASSSTQQLRIGDKDTPAAEMETDEQALCQTFNVKVNMFAITDYLYYCRLVNKVTESLQQQCLRAILTDPSLGQIK